MFPLSILRKAVSSKILKKIDRYSTLGCRGGLCRGAESTVWGAAFRAKLTFFQNYFVRLGFLDGPQGLTLAVTDGVNKFFKYAKLSELSKKGRNDR